MTVIEAMITDPGSRMRGPAYQEFEAAAEQPPDAKRTGTREAR
jgi:hypothetical protein